MTVVDQIDADALRLQSLGYKQELTRGLTRLTNYGMALSVICVPAGVSYLFGYGMITGGPVVMVWGWLVVSIFTLCVGLGMAEICSAYPTSGGLYFWAGMLVPEKYKPIASWFTGWFNLAGQFAATAAFDFGLAMLLASVVSVGVYSQWSPKPFHLVLIHLGLVISHGVCNSIGARFFFRMAYLSTWCQLLAPIIVALALLIGNKGSHLQASSVFTLFNNDTGWSSKGYVILIGLLQAQLTLCGYDISAHMSEETKKADVAGAWGMIAAILVSAVVGWLTVIAFLLGIHDYQGTEYTPTGFPVTQILLDNFGRELTIFFMSLFLVACWFGGFASVTANSRMIYAFSRDHAMPGSRWWHTIHPRLACPLNAVWLSCFVGFILALPYLGNSTAFYAITSLCTICLYISYVLPIICKLIFPGNFVPGPFYLGRFSRPINVIAVLWVALITVLFVLPTINPVTGSTMNYASVGVGGVFIFSGLGYALSARHWFRGPVTNLDRNDIKEHVDNLAIVRL